MRTKANRIKVSSGTRRLSELRPHDLNEKIYCCALWDEDMVESIRVHGLLEPLLITEDNRIVSGHRRWDNAKRAGLREVPVVVGDFDDELQISEAVVHANKQRVKTDEQKAREVRELKRIARKRAKARRASKLKQNNGKDTDPEILPERGDSRDIAAASVGWSGKTGDKAVAVVDEIDRALEAGDVARAFDLRDTLNNESVSAAHAKIETELANANQTARQKPVKEVYCQGLAFAVMAITQLKRIHPKDTQLEPALDKVQAWLDDARKRLAK